MTNGNNIKSEIAMRKESKWNEIMADGTDVQSWSNESVNKWVHSQLLVFQNEYNDCNINSDDIISRFKMHRIKGGDLLALDRNDLKDLHVTNIPLLRRMLSSIDKLIEQVGNCKHADYDAENSDLCCVEEQYQEIKYLCPTLLSLLKREKNMLIELRAGPIHVCESDASDNKFDDKEGEFPECGYWRRVEVMFILRLLIMKCNDELVEETLKCVTNKIEMPSSEELDVKRRDPLLVEKRMNLIQRLLTLVEESIHVVHQQHQNEAQVGTDGSSSLSKVPLFVEVAKKYQLNQSELIVMQCVIMCKIQRSDALRAILPNPLTDGNYFDVLKADNVCVMCGISKLELSGICQNQDEKDAPQWSKDRILEVKRGAYDEDDISFVVPDEICRALMGINLCLEDQLKISDTRLLSIIKGDDYVASKLANACDGDQRLKASPGQTVAQDSVLKLLQIVGDSDEGDDPAHKMSIVEKENDPTEEILNCVLVEDESKPCDDAENFNNEQKLVTTGKDGNDEKTPRCYMSELDYLNDQFSLMLLQVQEASQRLDRELKEAPVQRQASFGARSTEKKISSGGLKAKIRLAKANINLNLEETKKAGVFFPRLEGLVEQLGLSSFEKCVLVYLCGSMISPIFKMCIKEDYGSNRKCTVGDLLSVLCTTVFEQVAARKFFYRSSKLVRKGLVNIVKTYRAADLTDMEVQLDRRVLDCIVGLDKESTEITVGSNLNEPNVDFEKVVLSPILKNTIVDAVVHFDKFQKYRKKSRLDDAISYGVGLTIMFCGPSGTGKTMTANAIAATLKKKLLLVNFPRLSQGQENGDESSSPMQSIFREAELSNAIIFFDECESFFAKRGKGGSDQLTLFLTELERFEGIVFLATNRPFDLDEAMYRRISNVFEFKAPSHIERMKIWKILTQHDSIPCEETIDWEFIALQYELTGGFIKNAVIAALLSAVGRNSTAPMITEDDIINGCKKQMRGALHMSDFEQRVVPKIGLEGMIVTAAVKQQLQEMINIENARGILFGKWGFDDDMRKRQGTTALFWGPNGSGKNKAAEAVAFELGKSVKVVDFPQLVQHKGGKNSSSTIKDVFKEARLMDAVLVLDGHSLDIESRSSGTANNEDSRLLNLVVKEMTRFPGVVIMMLDTSVGSLDVFISHLDKSLMDGLKFIVKFNLPDLDARAQLWKIIIPSSLPLSGNIDFNLLAKNSDDFTPVQIGNAAYRAAATAAIRCKMDQKVTMADLKEALKCEKNRIECSINSWIKSQYI